MKGQVNGSQICRPNPRVHSSESGVGTHRRADRCRHLIAARKRRKRRLARHSFALPCLENARRKHRWGMNSPTHPIEEAGFWHSFRISIFVLQASVTDFGRPGNPMVARYRNEPSRSGRAAIPPLMWEAKRRSLVQLPSGGSPGFGAIPPYRNSPRPSPPIPAATGPGPAFRRGKLELASRIVCISQPNPKVE